MYDENEKTTASNSTSPLLGLGVVSNSLLDDLKEPLDKVQRSWIRKPAVIITCIVWLPIAMIVGAIDFTRRIILDCW